MVNHATALNYHISALHWSTILHLLTEAHCTELDTLDSGQIAMVCRRSILAWENRGRSSSSSRKIEEAPNVLSIFTRFQKDVGCQVFQQEAF